MFIGTNLVGMVVRGLVEGSPVREFEKSPFPPIREEATWYKRTNIGMTLFFALLSILYFWLLLRFWNIGVSVAAAMLMLARLPDLLWEIRTGQKISRRGTPTGVVAIVSTLMMWGCAPTTMVHPVLKAVSILLHRRCRFGDIFVGGGMGMFPVVYGGLRCYRL